MAAMNSTKIANRLLAAAKRAAENHKVRFGDGAEGGIASLASQSADRILQWSKDNNSPVEPLVKNGELVFGALVGKMVLARRKIRGYTASHPGIIGEKTLDAALKELCPLWPIC